MKETFTEAVERCKKELIEGEAEFMGEKITPCRDQQYTVTGHDVYNTVRGACLAIKKGKT